MIRQRIVYVVVPEASPPGWVAELVSEEENEPILAICSKVCTSRHEAKQQLPILEAKMEQMDEFYSMLH